VFAAGPYVKRHRTGVALIAGMAGLAVAAATVATMTVANASTEGTVPVGAIRAAAFAEQSGARVETTVDVGGGQDVGWLASGDWMRYNGPRPIPADPKRNAEFSATCRYGHAAPDDPIVFPGAKGASRLHSFVGNDSTNADTTT
jgi:hypothetical protein